MTDKPPSLAPVLDEPNDINTWIEGQTPPVDRMKITIEVRSDLYLAAKAECMMSRQQITKLCAKWLEEALERQFPTKRRVA